MTRKEMKKINTDNLLIYALISFIIGLISWLVYDCSGGKAKFRTATVVAHQHTPGYYTTTQHTDSNGKVYYSQDWHDDEYRLFVRGAGFRNDFLVSRGVFFSYQDGEQVVVRTLYGRSGMNYGSSIDETKTAHALNDY